MMSDLLVLAMMLAGITPDGWHVVTERRLGLDAYVYERADGTRVLAIHGTETAADLVAIPIRRIFGYSDRYVALAMDYEVDVVIGHSAGGGMASWVGHVAAIPSVTYNAAVPTQQALRNDGALQINVVVGGDRWGDPEARPLEGHLAGAYVRFDPPTGMRTHPMTTVLAAMQ